MRESLGLTGPPSAAAGELARRILDAIDTDAERVGRAIAAAARAQITAIGTVAANDPSFLARFEAQCAHHVRTLVAVTRAGRVPTDDDLSLVRELAERRAADAFPLDALLHELRVGHRVIWQRMLGAAQGHQADTEAVLWLTARSLEYVDAASAAVSDSYVGTRQALAAEADRVRRELVDEILSGRFPARADAAVHAAALGIEPDGKYVVLAAAEAGSPTATNPLTRERIRSTLERCAPRYASQALIVRRRTDVVAILPAHARARDLATAAATQLAHTYDIQIAVGIGPNPRGLAELAAGYEDAYRTLAVIRRDGGVATLDDLPLVAYLTAHADRTALRLATTRASIFATEGPDGALRTTLRAYLDSDLNIPQTAQRLVVHVNTVRYRLTRIEKLTGLDTRNFWDLTELATALAILTRHHSEHPTAPGPASPRRT